MSEMTFLAVAIGNPSHADVLMSPAYLLMSPLRPEADDESH
jgi:hypothetical protein